MRPVCRAAKFIRQVESGITTTLRSKGTCVWFTGLPCSGKSTIAQAVAQQLSESGKTVTLLDGDVVRPILCPDLGFSRADRRANVLRIAFVAREIVRHGGTAIVATISPFDEDRKLVRSIFPASAFLQVYVQTAIEECERRDVRGLYAKARAGAVAMFTGVSAPYEIPDDSELTCDTATQSVATCARAVLRAIEDCKKRRKVNAHDEPHDERLFCLERLLNPSST